MQETEESRGNSNPVTTFCLNVSLRCQPLLSTNSLPRLSFLFHRFSLSSTLSDRIPPLFVFRSTPVTRPIFSYLRGNTSRPRDLWRPRKKFYSVYLFLESYRDSRFPRGSCIAAINVLPMGVRINCRHFAPLAESTDDSRNQKCYVR